MVHITVRHQQGHIILDAYCQDQQAATDLLMVFFRSWKWEGGRLTGDFTITWSHCVQRG